MKLAIISDIHGNPLAFDAVLADINAQGGVDGYWFVGDYSALGYDPVTPLERIAALDNVTLVRGNTDRHTIAMDVPSFVLEEIRENPEKVGNVVTVARSFAWTRGYITAHKWLHFFDDLPLEQRLTLPDGTRMLAVHARPGADDGDGLSPDMTADEVRAMFGGAEADLVFVGHIHVPQDRQVGDLRVVNVASVSNPMRDDLRPHYVMLDADANGYQIDMRYVDVDFAAIIAAIKAVRHPSEDYLLGFWPQ